MANRIGDFVSRIEQFLICGPSNTISNNDDPSEESSKPIEDDINDFFTSSVKVSIHSTNSNRPSFSMEETNLKDDKPSPIEQCRLHSIRQRAISLVQQFQPQDFQNHGRDVRDIQQLLLKITHLKRASNQEELLQRIHAYLQKQHQLQLLILARAMQKLDRCTNILEIPELILSVKHSMPKVIVDGTKIKSLIDRVVSDTRSHLLKKFHCFFEEQLNEESLANITDPSMSRSHSGKRSMWEVFLRRSRDWLLSYSLVSILPVTLSTQSNQIVLEKFQDSWDEALTPIWGRFYHHLRMTRDSKSKNQIIWTFNYSRSFIDMLINLCKQITQAEQMQQLCANVDYTTAGIQQIVDKSLKFLKAHIAQVFVEMECNQSFLMELIEEIVEFDNWLFFVSEARSVVAGSIRHGLAPIVYESKEIFHNWINLEQSLIYEQIHFATAAPSANPFDLHFCTSMGSSGTDRDNSVQTLTCYNSVYIVLSLFVNTRTRYSFFPVPAQWILSELILEPLLCSALGLLLYKIRCTSDLFNISVGTQLKDLQNSQEWKHFKSAVSYFQSAISEVPSNQLGKRVVADSKRCKKRWTIVQNWIPKILITKQHEQHGFDIEQLMKTALKVSEKFRNNTLEYRNEWTTGQSTADSIEDCVIMTRGLAITLVDVLERQFTNTS